MLMRYVDNSFTTAFYNTIGVDFVNISIILYRKWRMFKLMVGKYVCRL